jgi:hypothetical protein
VTRSLSRRRLLAAAVPGLLAGCLVASDESADGGEGGGEGEDVGGSDPEGDESAEGGESAGGEASGADSTTDGSTAEQTDDEPVTDEVGPDGSGLVVTSVDVRGVTDDGSVTTVDARLTVENRGRFIYGTVEFRVDAYASRPGSSERDSVGFSSVTRRFTSGNRFDDGSRRFDVSIAFRSRETNVRADTDWYEVDAAVRTADPV